MTIATARSRRPVWPVIVGFILINVLAKGAFLNINTGEYTDGVLQLQSWETRAGIYPPLYEFLARGVAVTGVSLEQAARIVSLLAASLCVWPVFWMGKRLGGTRSAGVFAAVLYTLSPLPWRWSVRVMTDSLYLLLSTGALVFLTESWLALRRAASPGIANSVDSGRQSAWFLAGATLLAGLAGFARYQGVLLAPLLAMVFLSYLIRLRRVPWLSAVAAITLAAAAAWWISVNQQMHAEQFASRTAATPLATFSAWVNTLESFVLISPYYMGYPVFALALTGIVYVRRWAFSWYPRPAAILWGLYAVMLLVLHAAFGSFQYRYMMPLVPMVSALGGVGMVALERWSGFENRPGRGIMFRAVTLVSVLYLSFFGMAVLVLQREAFGDQREAAAFIRDKVPLSTPIFSNERYGPHVHLGSVKLSQWSGRPVQVLLTPDQTLPDGSILVLGTAYGGNDAVSAMMLALEVRYTLQPLTPVGFRSEIVPLMDDIMTNPMMNQNPTGWVMRYVPQSFATQIFEVRAKSGAGAQDGP